MIKEKAIKKRSTVKGTVLFTVVCVMMVLIVFLMGTLALAATANKRANFKYQKAQNETIARTVIEAVVKDIRSDTSEDGINNALASHPTFDMMVELDSRQYPVTVSRGGKQCWYDETLGWVEGDIINLTTTVTSRAGNEPVHYNASIVMSIEEEEEHDDVHPNPAGGAFVSLGDLSPKIGTQALTSGGTEIGLNFEDPSQVFVDIGHAGGEGCVVETPVYINGNGTLRTDFYTYIPSMQYTGDEKRSVFFAVNGNLTIDDKPFGMQFGTDMKWKSKTNNTSDVTNYVNIPCLYVAETISTNTRDLALGNEENAVNLYCGAFNLTKGINTYGDIYCFDANKTSVYGDDKTAAFGNNSKLLHWAEKQIKNIDGDVELHKFGNIYSKGSLEIYNQADDGADLEGDVRAEKNIKIVGGQNAGGQVHIHGDVVCGGVLTIGRNVKIDGDIYADTLVLTSDLDMGPHRVYCNHITGSKLKAADIYYGDAPEMKVWYDYEVTRDEWVQQGPNAWDPTFKEYDVKITTNTKMGGNTSTSVNQITVKGTWGKEDPGIPDGLPNEYKDHLNEGSAITYSGGNLEGNKHVETGYINTTDMTYQKGVKTILIYPKGFTKKEITDNIINVPTADQYKNQTNFPTSRGSLNRLVTILKKTDNPYPDGYQTESDDELAISKYSLSGDAPSTITNSCMLTGTAFQDYTFAPTGVIAVILKDVTLDSHKFYIDDSKGTVLFFVEGTFSLTGTGSGLMTTYYAAKVGTAFEVHRTGVAKDYPKVYIYGAPGSTVSCDGNPMVTANIRAPETIYQGKTGASCDITYIDSATKKMNYIGVIGQCIAKQIEVDNTWGLAYVEPSSGGDDDDDDEDDIQDQDGDNDTVHYSANGASINYTIY